MTISVLIIDDEESVRTSLAEFLDDYDFDVTTAVSGEEGLQLLREQRFQVAVVDLRLPGINGEAFILRAQDFAPQMRYLIHTGSVDYAVSRELREMGIGPEHLYAKPQSDLMRLIEGINALLDDAPS